MIVKLLTIFAPLLFVCHFSIAQLPPGTVVKEALYVKVKMLEAQKTPVVVHIFGRRANEPWYTGHFNINKNGLFKGSNKGTKVASRMKAGDESPWVNIAPMLSNTGNNRLKFYAMTNYNKPLPEESSFTLYFSTTKSMEGLIKKFSRKGQGAGMICNINLADVDNISNEEVESAKNLAHSKALPPTIPGRRSRIFPFGTGLAIDPSISSKITYNNELTTLSNIGINMLSASYPDSKAKGFNFSLPHLFITYLTKPRGCLNSPLIEKMDYFLKRHIDKIKRNNTNQKAIFLNLMDEPGFYLSHVVNCPVCRKNFPAFLHKNKLTAAELGIASLDEALPVSDKKQGALYYLTVRYTNSILTEFFRQATKIINKHSPDLRTGVNIANELIANMVNRGCDWFELYESGALTFGWTEDWLNWSGSYQLAGYQMATMRAACRKKNIPYGIYNILSGRTPWEIQSKGFTEIGHGSKAIHFYNYGPHYAPSSDQNSQRPEIYEPIKRLVFATGAVEKEIENAEVVKGDAAMLLSVTSDIWNYSDSGWPANLFGQERTYLYLLLRHCGLRLDILSENDLEDKLNDYKLLFITGSNLKKSTVKPLSKWVANGGVLYLGAGAAAFDEYNKDLNLDETLNIKRGNFKLIQMPGRPPYELPRRKVLDTVKFAKGSIPVICGTQEIIGGTPLAKTNKGNSALTVFKVGKGQVVCCGFFPANSYMKEAKINRQAPDGGILSCVKYPLPVRKFMQKIIEQADVSPKVKTDNPLVEVNLLETPKSLTLCFANWTGKPQTVSVTLRGYSKFSSIKSVTGNISHCKNNHKSLTFKLKLNAGDFVVCKK